MDGDPNTSADYIISPISSTILPGGSTQAFDILVSGQLPAERKVCVGSNKDSPGDPVLFGFRLHENTFFSGYVDYPNRPLTLRGDSADDPARWENLIVTPFTAAEYGFQFRSGNYYPDIYEIRPRPDMWVAGADHLPEYEFFGGLDDTGGGGIKNVNTIERMGITGGADSWVHPDARYTLDGLICGMPTSIPPGFAILPTSSCSHLTTFVAPANCGLVAGRTYQIRSGRGPISGFSNGYEVIDLDNRRLWLYAGTMRYSPLISPPPEARTTGSIYTSPGYTVATVPSVRCEVRFLMLSGLVTSTWFSMPLIKHSGTVATGELYRAYRSQTTGFPSIPAGTLSYDIHFVSEQGTYDNGDPFGSMFAYGWVAKAPHPGRPPGTINGPGGRALPVCLYEYGAI